MKASEDQARDSTQPIILVQKQELKPGNLWWKFKQGAKAIQLTDDDRIETLWKGLGTLGLIRAIPA